MRRERLQSRLTLKEWRQARRCTEPSAPQAPLRAASARLGSPPLPLCCVPADLHAGGPRVHGRLRPLPRPPGRRSGGAGRSRLRGAGGGARGESGGGGAEARSRRVGRPPAPPPAPRGAGALRGPADPSPWAASAGNVARATVMQIRPALSELYRSRAAAYRDGLREFVLAYREAYAEAIQEVRQQQRGSWQPVPLFRREEVSSTTDGGVHACLPRQGAAAEASGGPAPRPATGDAPGSSRSGGRRDAGERPAPGGTTSGTQPGRATSDGSWPPTS